ncbi:DsbA family protein [Patescibacteria group bacterium]|nr:DsbA family protein [Patescibacteria group bacterium]MCL5409387.1 DsbA family protein [Patescibacteria group bacterium]
MNPEDTPANIISTPAAILIGSLIIAIAILVSNGTIKLRGLSVDSTASTTTPTQSTTNTNAAPSAAPQVTMDQVKSAFNKSLIKFGDTNSKLIVLEIADPSCPYCQIASGQNPDLNKQAGSQFLLASEGGSYVAPVPELEKLVKNSQAAFSYIYFPGHGNGEMGAQALYCAFEEGKFWEVSDMLNSSKGYDLLNNVVKNDKTKSADLANFLKPVFDVNTMKQCLDSGKYASRLQTETALASSLGVSGTPGFFLNTTNFAGAYNYTEMQSIVDSYLK